MQADFDAFEQLLAAVCEDRATAEEIARLSALLRESSELRDRYLYYMDLHAQLASDPTLFGRMAAPARVDSAQSAAATASHTLQQWSQVIHPRRHPLAFATTVVVLTLAYWLGVHATFLRPKPNAPPLPAGLSAAIDVAVLSGTHEVQWASQVPHYDGERLLAGSLLQFSQGVVEVTFDTGVRVVVEGPARLHIEGAAASRLREGKLVAFVPKEGRGFVLDLPGARIIDLGTEFGVVARPAGVADITVYQGMVKVVPPRDRKVAWRSQQLVAGQSLRLAHDGGSIGPASDTVELALLRALPSNHLALDVADIVAGGSGRGRGANAGLHFHDGSRANHFRQGIIAADNAYHPVAGNALIDGVFFIRGDAQPQPIVSQDRGEFVFPRGTGQGWGPLWAWEPKTDDLSSHTWIYTYPHNPGRLLAMHANSGMTLDLAEVRATYPEHRVDRLVGYVVDEFVPDRGGRGNRTAAWVIVDGTARVANLPLRSGEAPARIDVALQKEDRFLTLAATDGGDGLACDFVMWRHLRLLLEPAQAAQGAGAK